MNLDGMEDFMCSWVLADVECRRRCVTAEITPFDHLAFRIGKIAQEGGRPLIEMGLRQKKGCASTLSHPEVAPPKSRQPHRYATVVLQAVKYEHRTVHRA